MKKKKAASKTNKNNSQKKIQSIAVLCSGGDAPGMNAALRAVVRAGIYNGLNVFGVYKGYSGLLEGHIEEMSLRSVANIIQRGGTILKTDRCKAFFEKAPRAEAVHILKRKKIDALVVIGGEGSFTGAHLMSKENDHYPVVGLPGTIDNDVYGSEYTIGFDTAVNTALDAIDKIRDTASSHDRVFLVEVMGRTSAEIAIRVGVSGGAETIIVPEEHGRHLHSLHLLTDTEKKLIQTLDRSVKQGKMSSIVVVAEGYEGGAQRLSEVIKRHANIEPRVAILGHVQRGGVPSALDRFMGSIMGAEAVSSLLENHFDVGIGQIRGKVARIPLRTIIGKHKKPDQRMLKLAEILAS